MNYFPFGCRPAQLLAFVAVWVVIGSSLTGCSYKNKPILFKTPQEIEQNGEPLVIWGPTMDSSFYKESYRLRTASDSLAARASSLRKEAAGKGANTVANLYRQAKDAETLSARYEKMADSIMLVGDSLSNVPYMHRIKPDDMISLRFLNNFDLAQGVAITNGQSELTFLVDREGYVYLPMLGKVKLGGMTRNEASRYLESLYAEDFKNPSIEVYISNLYVTVLGAVRTEGNFPIMKEHTTLVEVLALAGGINELSKKRQVKVLRSMGPGQTPQLLIFDLTQIGVLAEEDIVLHDKDIVYVEPSGLKVVTERFSPILTIGSFATSTVALTVTIITVFRNRN